MPLNAAVPSPCRSGSERRALPVESGGALREFHQCRRRVRSRGATSIEVVLDAFE